MSEGTRARGRLTPAPFAIPRDGGSIPPISTTWPLQVAVQGRAVVTAVSRWPASVVAVVLLVSISPRHRVRCAKKFALRARNTPNLTFLRLLGEFCRGLSGGGAVPGEFCRVCRPATVPGTVPGPTLPRPCHRPRNSSWPDTTPALPLPTGTAAWPVGTAISHAIPQQLVQTLNLHRWNCNVFWVC